MNIVYQVWEDKRMPTDTKISLEMLSRDDDGIFPNERSWNSFVTNNFGDDWRTQKKYCYQLEQYKYMAVAPEDLEFTFEYIIITLMLGALADEVIRRANK